VQIPKIGLEMTFVQTSTLLPAHHKQTIQIITRLQKQCEKR